jgi:tetratricopeptide (TPR) repeat protein
VTPTEQAVHPSQEVVPFPIFALNQERSAEGIYLVERRAESALGRVAQIPWGCLYRAVPASQAELWRSRAPAPSPSPFRIEGRPFLYGAEERLIACRSLLLQGDYAWDRGDRALADAFYQQAHRIGADLVAVAAHLGLRYSEQRRPQIARQVYEEALKRHDDALLRNRLGAVYGRLDRLEQAEQQFRRAIKLKPDYADAHANLGSVYGRAGRMQDAIRETEYALACDPNHLLALRNLGFSYAYTGRRTEAKRMLERALDIDPDQQDVRALLEAQ